MVSECCVEVEFSGGMEVLFDNRRRLSIPLSNLDKQTPLVKDLINYLKVKEYSKRKPLELFIVGESVRPGILVLINDTDWELEGLEDYKLKGNDHIVFISTLHGG